MKELMDTLKNPSKEYRAMPFWSWNDKLDSEMLKWQISEMDKAGLGGYFMHARGGLQTEYLSDEWMKCTKVGIEEGEKLGMNSWFYDENGWPSGFAGGIITSMGDRYHVRWLEIEETIVESIIFDEQILGIYSFDLFTNKIFKISQLELEKYIDKKIYVIRHKSNPYYIDILNSEVIKSFIDVTHEKYYEVFKEDFEKGLLGFFTDEPQYSRGEIPWSYILTEEFKKRFGYDLLDSLPALFVQCEGYEKIRYDFWTTVSSLYVTSFGKQIFDWCEAHHCRTTGHAMMEDSMYDQMCATAGGMPFYQYLHIPGMDWLGRKISSPVIPKQVSSVANQLDKKFVLSETFALCGWNVNFEELKWIAEWQYVNGVSLMCQHLEGYSLRGLRKRDYPPSLFYQQSWWEEYKLYNDYFARLGVLLTSGKNVVEVLLIHPMKSGWIAYDHSNNETLVKLDKDFVNATETLSGLHIDHHYGDESLIKEHGKVNGDKFIIGNCSYSIVVMPSMMTIDKVTLELINKFMANGGKVISYGDFPRLCEGIHNGMVDSLKDRVLQVSGKASLYNSLRQINLPQISICAGNGEIDSIHYMQRDLGEAQLFFVVNHDQEQTFNSEIALKGKGRVRKFVYETAEFEELEYRVDGDFTKLNLKFLPMQSHVLLLDFDGETKIKAKTCKEKIISIKNEWTIGEMDLNSLTLDYCSYSIDNGEWIGPIHTIKLMDLLLELRRACDISLKFNFKVNMDLEKNKEFFIAVEMANEFEISINGNLVPYTDKGWWKDISFKKLDIKKYVAMGENEIVLKRKFYQSQKVYDVLFGENVLETEKNKLTFDVELESIYVVGDFGVISESPYSYGERKAVFTDGPFSISDKPTMIQGQNLIEQGLCFFSGIVKLNQSVNIKKDDNTRLLLDIGKPESVISKVFVNGTVVKVLPWAPYTVDITDYVNEGDNNISIALFSSNRNLLGPHHHISGESYSVGPATFTDKPGWTEFGGTCDFWRDKYCFVRFGL